MKPSREQLIAELTASVPPVTWPGKTGHLAALWLGLLVAGVVGLILIREPLRPGAFVEQGAAPQFLGESLPGLAAIVALGVAAFRSGISTTTPMLHRAALPLTLLAAWVGCYLYGLADPALVPSMAGKRAHCWLETLAYSVPGLLFGCWALRRLWPLHGVWSGALLGLMSGAVPALVMQFACMYQLRHILLYHLFPGLALGALGALVGAVLLRPREI
ncbi:MAG: DUF1109 domain-containing protein [Gammaproteobacteria bacterium]|nr:DUF1109 domain-containing protein [Gammaproteobacteria bacterium]